MQGPDAQRKRLEQNVRVVSHGLGVCSQQEVYALVKRTPLFHGDELGFL